MPERARPRGPAAAGDELTLVGVRARVRVEVFLPQPPYLRQPGIVGTPDFGAGGLGELGVQEGRQRPRAVLAGDERRRGREIGEPALALFDDQPGILEQAQVPRHAGLRDPENPRQLADVEPLGAQDAQNPQPGVVAEQLEQAGGLCHIYKSTSMDVDCPTAGRSGVRSCISTFKNVQSQDLTFGLSGRRC